MRLMRLINRPCRKLRHSQCEGMFCSCMCHLENAVARAYGQQFAHPVADGEDRGASRGVSSWKQATPPRAQPGVVVTGDRWRWWHTVMSGPTMLYVRRWRWQQARSIAREEAVRGAGTAR